MKPLSIVDLKEQIADANLSESSAPVVACVDAFNALKENASRTDSEDKLFFECALALQVHGFHGLGTEAALALGALVAANGVDHYRPAPPEPETPDSAE